MAGLLPQASRNENSHNQIRKPETPNPKNTIVIAKLVLARGKNYLGIPPSTVHYDQSQGKSLSANSGILSQGFLALGSW